MAEFVYILCAATAIACAALLCRSYRRRRTKLLFWSSLCFVGLALNNVLLLIDLYVFPQIDLFVPRTASALLAMGTLIYGLIRSTP